MVDEVETAKVLEELSRSNAGASSPGSQRQKQGRTGSLLLVILLIPLLAGAVLLGYQQWTLYLRLNSLATQNNQLLESLQSSNERLTGLEAVTAQEDSAADQAAVDGLRQEFNSRLEQLDLMIAELRERGLNSPLEDDANLLLVEAEHLLRIANRHLQLTDDIATTVTLLENADQLLLESGDSRAVPVREALARELVQLRNVQEVDVDGLYLRLAALREPIENLEIGSSIGATYQQQLSQVREQNADASTAESAGSLLDSGLDFFSSIFVWRKWEDTPEIVQPSREILYVRQNIDLLIEQAQLALLTRRPMVFRQNLQAARDLIARYGAASDQAAAQVMDQLDSLLGEELSPEPPDISRSLLLLRQVNSRQPTNPSLQ